MFRETKSQLQAFFEIGHFNSLFYLSRAGKSARAILVEYNGKIFGTVVSYAEFAVVANPERHGLPVWYVQQSIL